MMKRLFVLVCIVAVTYVVQHGPAVFDLVADTSPIAYFTRDTDRAADSTRPQFVASGDNDLIQSLYQSQRGNVQVMGNGTVSRILPDDNDGSRHQRFILRMDSGQTLLIAHNIDLAPRIAGLALNDVVTFYGEYEWNREGGVIHWTHRDPAGRHVSGWLHHGGRTYQ